MLSKRAKTRNASCHGTLLVMANRPPKPQKPTLGNPKAAAGAVSTERDNAKVTKRKSKRAGSTPRAKSTEFR
jgi:hypothetical protein